MMDNTAALTCLRELKRTTRLQYINQNIDRSVYLYRTRVIDDICALINNGLYQPTEQITQVLYTIWDSGKLLDSHIT